jgi:hypothetical protein
MTKEFSATPTSGGTLRTLALLDQLASTYETTVVSPDAVLTKRLGEPLVEVFRTPGAADPIRDLRTSSRYRSISGVRTAGARLLANLARGASGHYDVAIIDHTALAGLADGVAVGCDQLVISMHNIESDLMAQRSAAAGSTTARVVMRAESRLLRRLEAHISERYPVLVCTEADARKMTVRHSVIVCRNGVFAGSAASPPEHRPSQSMVFSGALDWEPNISGLHWFIDQAWPLVRARMPAATVTIAGRNPGPAVIEACAAPGVTLLANPPVMATVLAAHQLGIVPLLSGGGSRIKILEYLAAGINIVSTDVGASGLEDIPDELLDRTPINPAVFADSLVRRLESPRDTSVVAQDWVRKNYSWDVTLRPLLNFLQR